MKICALKSVNGVPFGSDCSAVLNLGRPSSKSRNHRGEDELVFPGAIYRFLSNKLVEVSFRRPLIVELDEQKIPDSMLVSFLKCHDPEFREVYGFAIAPNFGLAVDLEHEDCWVSAFVAGRWNGIR